MKFVYTFNEEQTEPFEYEVQEDDRIVEGLAFCLVQLYAEKKKLTLQEHSLLWDTFCNFLAEQDVSSYLNDYEEDLKDYFEDEAYEEYMNG